MRSQAANEHFTLIYSCLGLQAAAHLCGQVMAMELAALFSLPPWKLHQSFQIPSNENSRCAQDGKKAI